MPYKNLIYGIAYSLYIQFIKTTGLLFPFNIHTPKKQKKIMIATTKRKIQNFEVDFYFFRFVHFLRKRTNPESTWEWRWENDHLEVKPSIGVTQVSVSETNQQPLEQKRKRRRLEAVGLQ